MLLNPCKQLYCVAGVKTIAAGGRDTAHNLRMHCEEFQSKKLQAVLAVR